MMIFQRNQVEEPTENNLRWEIELHDISYKISASHDLGKSDLNLNFFFNWGNCTQCPLNSLSSFNCFASLGTHKPSTKV